MEDHLLVNSQTDALGLNLHVRRLRRVHVDDQRAVRIHLGHLCTMIKAYGIKLISNFGGGEVMLI